MKTAMTTTEMLENSQCASRLAGILSHFQTVIYNGDINISLPRGKTWVRINEWFGLEAVVEVSDDDGCIISGTVSGMWMS